MADRNQYFQNGWIEAFQNIVDDDIDFEDAEQGADKGG